MCRKYWLAALIRVLVLGTAFAWLPRLGMTQELIPASPPIADPKDHRFVGVTEDFTTPAITTSTLRPVPPLIGNTADYPGYTVELDEVQWRWGDPLDLYIVKPKSVKKPPVIVYLYGYPTDTDTFRNEAWQRAVTKDGFAAVGFVTALTGHRYHDRPMKEWFVSDLQECLATSAHDVQMVLDYLGKRGDLDMNRLGMLAEGSGASVGILASAVDPRIKVLDTVDPWGDWPTWMATSPFVPKDERNDFVKPEYLKKVAVLDPVDWLPKIQVRKFRLQDAVFDTDTPKASQEKLRASVPASGTVVVYNTPQEYRAAINGNKVMNWMQGELRAVPDPAAPTTAALQQK
jgi:hypothetical protein